MNTEIEMKAWVDDPAALKERLRKLCANFLREYKKSDTYFHLMDGDRLKQELRLRSDGDDTIVTLKEKQVRQGLEVNVEREFSVSNSEHFRYLLECSGYEEFIRKEKIGTAYQCGAYLVELSHVTRLGTFIEVEELIKGSVSEEKLRQTDKAIRELLQQLGIGTEKIEFRGYTQMLVETVGK